MKVLSLESRVTPHASRLPNPHLGSSNNVMLRNWDNLRCSKEIFIGWEVEFVASTVRTLGATWLIRMIARRVILSWHPKGWESCVT